MINLTEENNKICIFKEKNRNTPPHILANKNIISNY